MQKCVFLDRDGVINKERGSYTYTIEQFQILPGVPEGLKLLKDAGFLTIIITNQGGISKGLFSRHQMRKCHQYLIDQCPQLIDDIYYCPYHSSISESLSRKPDSLMLEKAIAKYGIDPSLSWMVGDRERDLEASVKMGIKFIQILDEVSFPQANFATYSLLEAAIYITKRKL